MFRTIDYLQFGNDKQKRAYKAIQSLHLMNNLKEFTPILCGTIPLGIDVNSSDLDIIMKIDNFPRFEEKIRKLYGKYDNFQIKHTNIRGRRVVKANFFYQGFEFELFGQPQPVLEQYAYSHMIIEQSLLEKIPNLKEKVINLKKTDIKQNRPSVKYWGSREILTTILLSTEKTTV